MSEKLLADPAKAGLYHLHPARRADIVKTAGELHFQTYSVDLSQCRTVDNVLHHLGSALHFPDWYGANFDALYDCLSDTDLQPGKGHVVLINGLDSVRTADADGFTTLIEVFRAAAESRLESGTPFWILIDAFTEDLAELPTE